MCFVVMSKMPVLVLSVTCKCFLVVGIEHIYIYYIYTTSMSRLHTIVILVKKKIQNRILAIFNFVGRFDSVLVVCLCHSDIISLDVLHETLNF